jgi:hypothetical protein
MDELCAWGAAGDSAFECMICWAMTQTKRHSQLVAGLCQGRSGDRLIVGKEDEHKDECEDGSGDSSVTWGLEIAKV